MARELFTNTQFVAVRESVVSCAIEEKTVWTISVRKNKIGTEKLNGMLITLRLEHSVWQWRVGKLQVHTLRT